VLDIFAALGDIPNAEATMQILIQKYLDVDDDAAAGDGNKDRDNADREMKGYVAALAKVYSLKGMKEQAVSLFTPKAKGGRRIGFHPDRRMVGYLLKAHASIGDAEGVRFWLNFQEDLSLPSNDGRDERSSEWLINALSNAGDLDAAYRHYQIEYHDRAKRFPQPTIFRYLLRGAALKGDSAFGLKVLREMIRRSVRIGSSDLEGALRSTVEGGDVDSMNKMIRLVAMNETKRKGGGEDEKEEEIQDAKLLKCLFPSVITPRTLSIIFDVCASSSNPNEADRWEEYLERKCDQSTEMKRRFDNPSINLGLAAVYAAKGQINQTKTRMKRWVQMMRRVQRIDSSSSSAGDDDDHHHRHHHHGEEEEEEIGGRRIRKRLPIEQQQQQLGKLSSSSENDDDDDDFASFLSSSSSTSSSNIANYDEKQCSQQQHLLDDQLPVSIRNEYAKVMLRACIQGYDNIELENVLTEIGPEIIANLDSAELQKISDRLGQETMMFYMRHRKK